MFYRSANFDEDVFEDPYTFNILRNPNPHVGFGGTGVHYCVGANLAKMTINLIFNAVADHMPDLTSAGTPQRLRSGWCSTPSSTGRSTTPEPRLKHFAVGIKEDSSWTSVRTKGSRLSPMW